MSVCSIFSGVPHAEKKMKQKTKLSKNKRKLLNLPIFLCDKHFKEHNKPFEVKTSSKWKYIAIPNPCFSASCHICTDSLNEPSFFLREANFAGLDLRYANLRYANLTNSDLSDADLRYADLSNANLANSDLSNSDMSYANCYNANFRYVNFRGANLKETNFYNANLYDANLRHTNLEKTSFRFANLASSTFGGAKNKNAVFSTAHIMKTHGLNSIKNKK